jgi:heat shock protein HslJ
MTTLKLAAVIALTLALMSLSSASPFLKGTRWELVHYQQGKNIVIVSNKMRPTLEFEIGKARANGFSGCNQFGGTYTARSSGLTFSSLVSTRKACESERMRLEAVYMQLLQTSKTFKLGDTVLLITSQGGSLLYRKIKTY